MSDNGADSVVDWEYSNCCRIVVYFSDLVSPFLERNNVI